MHIEKKQDILHSNLAYQNNAKHKWSIMAKAVLHNKISDEAL